MTLPRTQADVDAHNARVEAGKAPRRARASSPEALRGAVALDTPLKRHSASQQTEEDVAQAVIKEIQRRGWLTFRSDPTHRTCRRLGEPDLEVWADQGRTYHLELKRPVGGKLSMAQLGVIAWGAKLGHTVHVVTSLEEFVGIVDC